MLAENEKKKLIRKLYYVMECFKNFGKSVQEIAHPFLDVIDDPSFQKKVRHRRRYERMMARKRSKHA